MSAHVYVNTHVHTYKRTHQPMQVIGCKERVSNLADLAASDREIGMLTVDLPVC